MNITCKACKQEVDVALFFYDAHIQKVEDPIHCFSYSRALCRAKAICPCCGQEIHEYFEKDISKQTIIKLATGEEA